MGSLGYLRQSDRTVVGGDTQPDTAVMGLTSSTRPLLDATTLPDRPVACGHRMGQNSLDQYRHGRFRSPDVGSRTWADPTGPSCVRYPSAAGRVLEYVR